MSMSGKRQESLVEGMLHVIHWSLRAVWNITTGFALWFGRKYSLRSTTQRV